MRPRFLLASALSLALYAATAHAQPGQPVFAPSKDVVPASCASCTTVPGTPEVGEHPGYPPEYSRHEHHVLRHWVRSNKSCENCATWRSELDFIFGSCSDFNCGEVKRDLANKIPLAAYYGITPSPYPTVRPPTQPGVAYRIIPIEGHCTATAALPSAPAATSQVQTTSGIMVNDLRR